MAAKKYISQVSGVLTEVQATVTSAGAGDDGKIVALDSSGKLDTSVMPVGIGADTLSVVASEALTAGDLVNLWDDAGTGKVRKADCSNGRRADGFVLSGVSIAGTATVYFESTNTAVTGLTIGATYYLSTTGAVTATAPTTSGYIVQEVGRARSATAMPFEPQQPITLA
jgi:hypothetical protein